MRQKLRRVAAMLDAEPLVTQATVLRTPTPMPTFTLLPELSNVSLVNFEDLHASRPYEDKQDWPDFGGYAHNDLFEGLDFVEKIDGWRDARFHKAMADDMQEACQRGLLTKYLLVMRRNSFAQVKQSGDSFVGGTGLFDVFLVDLEGEAVVAKLSLAADTSGLAADDVPTSRSDEEWHEFVRGVHGRIDHNAKEFLTVELNKLLGTELELWAR